MEQHIVKNFNRPFVWEYIKEDFVFQKQIITVVIILVVINNIFFLIIVFRFY